MICNVCPHGCELRPGYVGRCRARTESDGASVPLSYGCVTSLAIDPVEKKPLARWRSGQLLLSVGSYGCNLRCPFCQNHEIAQVGADEVACRKILPEELLAIALASHDEDSRVTGIAYTYNEPLIAWEYIRDTGILAHQAGLANALVSNGYAQPWVIDELAPLIDAANIDLKGFTEDYYRWCGGSLAPVQRTIERLAAEPGCHLEVTCLVVPGHNDSASEMRALAHWLAGVDPDITLHVTRFFGRWQMSDAHPTPIRTIYQLADVAREELPHVVVGNC